jgi:three-Cys-motif partner protein
MKKYGIVNLVISLGGRMNKDSWGGSWTEQKLDAFEKYVGAYLTIMNKYRDEYGWKLIYFDAFAGSGKRGITKEDKQMDQLFDITPEEESIYQGAAERVIRIERRGFDYYYFIEKDEVSRKELENLLSTVKIEKNLDLHFSGEDANEQLHILADTMKKNRNLCSLTLLDPFGMQVNWDSIKQLKDTRTDLWILIPSGVIINRLLERDGKLKNIEKLVSFFGLSEQELREYFYEQDKKSNGLFGLGSETQKVSMPIQRITELYIQQLKTIFKEVTPKPLEMRNSRNFPLFHFAFASNNSTALRIANDIIGKESK